MLVRILFVIMLIAVVTDAEMRSRLAPVLQPALDPVYEWSARYRLREIGGFLATDHATGRPLPETAGLAAYLASHGLGGDGALDPWGERFYVDRSAGRVRVGSAGRDRMPRTPDDVYSPAVGDGRR